MSKEEYADPRADVNQDGVVNTADLLEIRSPANWNKRTGPETPPTTPPSTNDPVRAFSRTNTSTDPNSTAFDVRTANQTIANTLVTSSAHCIVMDNYWQQHAGARALHVVNCTLRGVGYGLYLGCDDAMVSQTIIQSDQRDPIRVAGASHCVFEDLHIKPTQAAASFRVHDNARNITVRRCVIEATNPWGIDLGEQYAGAGGIVDGVLIEDCTFIACPQTIMGIRVRARNVTIRNCKGLGFAAAQPGAVFVQLERHSCDPVGCRLEYNSCVGRPLYGKLWVDTVTI